MLPPQFHRQPRYSQQSIVFLPHLSLKLALKERFQPNMKSILITALLGYLIAPCHAQVAPMTGTTPDALISAVVAKYCDVYSMQPRADSIFVFGSSARDELHQLGVEEIIITCLDGHQKTFWMGKELKRKMAQIDYVSATEGIIEWSDKTKSRSKTYYSTVRPVTYVVISKG